VNTAEDKWNLLPAFLKVKGLIKQHIDSFNYFLQVEIHKIVVANQNIVAGADRSYWIRYLEIRVGTPEYKLSERRDLTDGYGITPHECRLRDMTYSAPIYVDVQHRKGHNSPWAVKKNIELGRIPIMLRSANCVLVGKNEHQLAMMHECSMDPGGYFVVRGQEKVILVQEQLSRNRVLVECAKGIVQASVTSSTSERKSKTYVMQKNGRLVAKHNILSDDIPIVILFKAMGIQSDQEILSMVTGRDAVYQDIFIPNFEDIVKENINTQLQALEYIGQRVKIMRKPGTIQKRNYAQEAIEALTSIMITHVPVEGMDFRPKALYFAFMARRVLMAVHDPTLIDDRDYVGNKRLELAGQMLALLFEDIFKRLNTDVKLRMDKVLQKPNRTQAIEPWEYLRMQGDMITQGMERAIATGNWTLKRFKMERAGVSHVLSRLSYISALGMLTRISSQFEKTRKVSGPRALQTSQFGMLCPADTPEGEQCGLVKNLALMTHVTTEDPEGPIRRTVFMLGAEDLSSAGGEEMYQEGAYLVFINGTPMALTKAPKRLLTGFRKFRRMGRISEFVSIFINHDHRAVHIATDEGRICRPLIIVENSQPKVTARHLQLLRGQKMAFDDFLAKGLVEYVDVNEENDSDIAMYEKDMSGSTTHLEIEPFTLLGAVAGLIPYPHHNQSPRNTYQCAMGKQAIGAIAYNQFERIDSLLYLMVYPQRPMVKSRTIELVHYDELPAGQNATVAVMSYSGYDIEDALVLNKASCDRGFGRCQVYKKVSLPLRRFLNGNQEKVNVGVKQADNARHKVIGNDGVVEPGIRVKKNDVIVLKQTPKDTAPRAFSNVQAMSRAVEYRDNFHSYRTSEPSIIDKVSLTASDTDVTIIKILTRQTRRPELGDKFSSRHGQKGVVGLIAEQADMPFDQHGVCPDVIMNPHGFPSRMTVGKMMELVSGKAGVLMGEHQYGTAFGGSDCREMGDVLLQHGYSYEGKDMLTCGISGEVIPAYIFFGPIYYQKLKHMVQDKMHARATGPIAMLTRQPTEGRARDGGLRLGEMERDCLIAYGAAQLLRERLMLSSDKHECDVCSSCGGIGYHGWCQTCKSSVGVRKMTMPYAAKLLTSELSAMNIRTSLRMVEEFPNWE
jgi:DNA-directed RNA polymerase III subunit RPC2